MGIVVQSCINYNKDKDDKDDKPRCFKKKATIETVMKTRNCKIKVTLSDKELNKSTMFKSHFNGNPFKNYEILKEMSPFSKKVRFLRNPNIIRYMRIIDAKDIIGDEEKQKEYRNDINLIKSLDHPNLIRILEIFIYENKYYLICNYVEERSLVTTIKNIGIEDESIILKILKEILNLMIYLQERNIYNIDLNLKKLIIIEFGIKTMKKVLKRGKNSSLLENSKSEDYSTEQNKSNNKLPNLIQKKYEIRLLLLGYLEQNYEISNESYYSFYSPEIVQQIENNNLKKDKKENIHAEEWAFGVLMYYLICGEFPFKGETMEETFSNIKNSSLDFPAEKFNSISHAGKELLSSLLMKEHSKRITFQKCLNHPFFTGKKPEEINKDLLKELLNIKKPRSKFHEIIKAYLCYHFIDKMEEKKLTFIFKYIDEEHNNIISDENIKNAFKKNDIDFTDEQIDNILDVFDYDQNNKIKYQEFLRIMCNKEDLYTEENMKSVFDAIDVDKNGVISSENIECFVTQCEDSEEYLEKELLEPFGMKPGDKITYDQFCNIIKNDKTFEEVNDVKNRIM